MHPVERNPRFSNPLANSTSPYLRQHAHNPVFWYPWGKEALERARSENKPILLSIGYSTCYWCHVMEREVFENLSIASLMNRLFINIKVDREELPQIDEIYMVARQLMTHEGGWPNNVFLTPDLKPFYAGGTFAPDDTHSNRPAFPRILEWLHHAWTTQRNQVLETAENVVKQMRPYMTYAPAATAPIDVHAQAERLYALLAEHHDARSGGFFQAPKFPHECFLSFLLAWHEHSGRREPLDIVTKTLGKMAAGGLQDQVGCGFHRYAVDKEWYVPHFEKMLYNQALLARTYTDAARLTGNAYFADVARSILDFAAGPFTDGGGAFYAAIDAETDSVEGAYYAWTSEEIQAILNESETAFFIRFFALADIPTFPGHKHVNGQVIIARKPLDEAARDENIPYVDLAAMAGQILNKLLIARNLRQPPRLDDKIITAWNGLMIDAYANAGKVFNRPDYIARARKAADFLLEYSIDNEGRLMRIYAAGRAQIEATLEDYAYLVRGLLTLVRASGDTSLLDPAVALMARCEELFADASSPGYFSAPHSPYLLIRGKNGEDSAIPSANAVMLHNLTELYAITETAHWRDKALEMGVYFLSGQTRALAESSFMIQSALRLDALVNDKKLPATPQIFDPTFNTSAEIPTAASSVAVSAVLFPRDAQPGDSCELLVSLDIKDGWHINAARVNQPFLISTQIDVQGEGITLAGIIYPEPLRKPGVSGEEPLLAYERMVTATVRLHLDKGPQKREKIRVLVRFQPCQETTCHKLRDITLIV